MSSHVLNPRIRGTGIGVISIKGHTYGITLENTAPTYDRAEGKKLTAFIRGCLSAIGAKPGGCHLISKFRNFACINTIPQSSAYLPHSEYHIGESLGLVPVCMLAVLGHAKDALVSSNKTANRRMNHFLIFR